MFKIDSNVTLGPLGTSVTGGGPHRKISSQYYKLLLYYNIKISLSKVKLG